MVYTRDYIRPNDNSCESKGSPVSETLDSLRLIHNVKNWLNNLIHSKQPFLSPLPMFIIYKRFC
jgi:hypothetical protein